jgi:hypothetical protein
MLLEEDPNLDVSFLEGGITAWKKAGGEVKNLGPKILSIDRQIYLSIGILLLLIFILGSCLHTAFHILSGAMGICLMIAGSTGWCGLEKLLVKMPWNR